MIAPAVLPDSIRLIEGDCLTVLSTIESDSIAAVFADPPYSSGGMTVSARRASDPRTKHQSGELTCPTFNGDSRDQRGFCCWCTMWMIECFRTMKQGGVIGVFTDWRQLPITTDAIQAAGFQWRGIVVWNKPNPRPQSGRFAASCEYIVWATKGPRDSTKGPCLSGCYTVPSVKTKDRRHSVEKPVELMEELIRVAWEPGDIVLDPFMGSGSTAVAAFRSGIGFVGIENSPEYIAIATDRIRDGLLDWNGGPMFAASCEASTCLPNS